MDSLLADRGLNVGRKFFQPAFRDGIGSVVSAGELACERTRGVGVATAVDDFDKAVFEAVGGKECIEHGLDRIDNVAACHARPGGETKNGEVFEKERDLGVSRGKSLATDQTAGHATDRKRAGIR